MEWRVIMGGNDGMAARWKAGDGRMGVTSYCDGEKWD